MAESSLQERLKGHADAFDGLLSLIPAKLYYEKEGTSEQHLRKKQTKAQADAARKAKLDPDSASAKNAKEVMEERVRKRKLEALEGEESDIEGVEKELPGQGLKKPQDKKVKKQKTVENTDAAESTSVAHPDATVAERRRIKSEKKATKAALKKEKQKEKKPKLSKTADQVVVLPAVDEAKVKPTKKPIEPVESAEDEDVEMDEGNDGPGGDIDAFDASGLEEPTAPEESATTSPSTRLTPIFDNPEGPSSNTSTTSIIPASTVPKTLIKLDSIDPEVLRARLAARIEALRAARKADGPDGAPAKNRQELMEARRKKEEQRRIAKKEQRLQAKAEEDARREAALASTRNSPASMMSPAIRSPDQNFSFGRVAFADGQQLSDNLSTLVSLPKKKGPQDPATALQASEKRRLRIAGFDDEKKADIAEKELWLNAKKRAHGEKVRDDSSLLKKTLKRKEKQKKKSEKEWGERKEGVAKSQAMKQKKREANLKERRDGKGKGKGKSAGSKKTKVKSRPGFEGSFGGKRK